ncbi:hypothetical protein CAPTEDRAFT_205340 [Capitella teleta]|uniref:Uncharacterized protein n=1 Tax=Capitella teleta TaxID=283909 RepID=R7TM11_CAPTE|nr:hypothetical protein CAPTEDRAFT_205340 [Capitella teleta]|eukprot:ELT94843.1 hypothetical protein CAPTEDRAFT_205340 [Capitella teleta]
MTLEQRGLGYFQIDVIVPGTFLHHSAYFSVEDVSSFCIEDVSLHQLISEEFIEAFVKKGRLYMISQDTYIDQHDTYALIPGGMLILLLNNSTFGELGLSASKSAYSNHGSNKHVVELDLTKPCFRPGKPSFERAKSNFKRCSQLKSNFLVTWVPHDEKICGSSIESYFKSEGFNASSCRLTQSESNDPCIAPNIAYSDPNGDDNCDAFSLLDWLGAMACGVDMYVTYIAQKYLIKMNLNNLEVRMKENLTNKTNPWFSLTVHGFHDSPVSWLNKEHGFHLHGDNALTLVFFPDGCCWTYKILASHDTL